LAWYQCDHLGTPQEITDQNGNTAWSAQYKAWGEASEQRSEFAQQVGLTNPIRFQGQYHDQETGLHYNRHRYYDPKVGRFISKDPIGYSGGLNLYHYVPNPVEWTDPLGLSKNSNVPVGTPKQAQMKIGKKQGPLEITRIHGPDKSVPHSQWHAHCKCGSGYNLDGSVHDKGRGDVTFSRKTIDWLNQHGWSIPPK
ncbi:RHS repeat domain-containing protein, partial [Pseudomonas sp. W2-17]|uniref:RHS repeat domain-containing protein n=1 Tax=Pseudomonas sp. W2-17 TaxID=3058039 RepID=UPI0034E09CE2